MVAKIVTASSVTVSDLFVYFSVIYRVRIFSVEISGALK